MLLAEFTLSAEQLKSLESLQEKIKEQIAKADSADSLKLLFGFK